MFRSLRLRIALSHALVLIVILLALGLSCQFLLAREPGQRRRRPSSRASPRARSSGSQEAGHAVPPADSDIPSAAGVQVAVFLARRHGARRADARSPTGCGTTPTR